MARTSEIVAGLDLGSSKVSCVIAEGSGGASPRNIIGVAIVPSSGGLRDGQVVSIDRTTESIVAAVDEASRMAGCQITNVRLGIGGAATMGFNSDGTVAIRGGRVAAQDVERVLERPRDRRGMREQRDAAARERPAQVAFVEQAIDSELHRRELRFMRATA